MSKAQLMPVNLPSFSADPTTGTIRAGDAYFNSVTKTIRMYDGAAWTNYVAKIPLVSVVLLGVD